MMVLDENSKFGIELFDTKDNINKLQKDLGYITGTYTNHLSEYSRIVIPCTLASVGMIFSMAKFLLLTYKTT